MTTTDLILPRAMHDAREVSDSSKASSFPDAAPHDFQPSSPLIRTVWGLDPLQLHNRYWAAHGVQVVAQGEPSEIVEHAELYLLTDPGTFTLFQLGPLMEALNWIKPQVLFVRLHDARDRGYRENVLLDQMDRFVKFQRLYDTSSRLTRVALTPDREIAKLWQSAPDSLSGWRRLRRFIPRHDRATRSTEGTIYDRSSPREVSYFVGDLVQIWKRPDSTVVRAKKFGDAVWQDPQAKIEPGAKFIGAVWVGAGRNVDAGKTVIGPAVIWDSPAVRPAIEAIEWLTIEPTTPPPPEPHRAVRGPGLLDRAAKRGFDIVFSSIAILLTVSLYPFIMLAIWLEDGQPFFFAHRRETRGGREFSCMKFRSMRKDAEQMKAELRKRNQADGPQFFMDDDPRLTRIGRILRKYNLDELPQFFNVLMGDMSIVGPRPSPHHENQYCPPWREARLSVRPGITGLWQIKRTRRAGTDFQEWIKFDIEYVERRSFLLDLQIIFQTVSAIVGRISRA
jgi:lipopolysaccharide/colanic/teichoic acid biosynthesis glycosyltransferase